MSLKSFRDEFLFISKSFSMNKYIIALFLGFSAMVQAQNKISGTITDVQNLPLSSVSVYAPEIHKNTITDAKGYYEINAVPNGNIKVSFSILGYTSQNKSILINEKETVFNLILNETHFEMDEVIVSTGFSKLQSQNVMKVEHETVASLQQKGTTTLIEGLATIPGVSQVSTGTSIGKPLIRGLTGNRVLVYSQGVRIENQQFGNEHGLGLNSAGVESVEVIKGPASLLYGSDAMGGVLYFNPEKFADSKSFKGDFSQRLFSNTLGSSSSLGLKTSTDKWKFLVRGTYDTHSDYQTGSNERVTNTRYNEKDFKTALGYSNSQFSSVLRYNYNKLDLGIPEDGIEAQSESKITLFPRQGVANHLLSWNNNFFFGTSKLEASLGYVANDRSEFEDSDVVALRMKLNTFNYDVKYHLPVFGNFESIFGIQGMYQTNDNLGEEYLIPNAKTNDIGVFATTNYQWKSNAIQAGLRYDNRKISSESQGILGDEGSFTALDTSFDSFNASLGYKTDLVQNLTLRMNIASGFRAPNLAELTSNGVHEGTNRYEIGNTNLKTEQNIQSDVNLEYGNTHFEFFVNGFYNHINNYIYTSPTGEILEENAVFEYTQDNAKLYGGEIGLHFHPHPLDWLHFESSFETVTGKNENSDYLPLIPANNWNNTIRTEFRQKKWLKNGFAAFNVSKTFNQKNISGFETGSDGYTLVNLGLGGTIAFGKNSLDLHLNANNLFNKTYVAHLSRLKTDGIANIGRNISLGVNFSF